VSDRARTAYHEAAHAAVAHMLRRPFDVVSIRAGEHYRGIAIFRGRSPQADLGKTLADVIWWPAPWRRRFEIDLAITLAGRFGEALRRARAMRSTTMTRARRKS
jgi:hypothetical protein